MTRIARLDGVRGIAILLVLVFHCEVPGFAPGGWVGVDLFFVLSGFLITNLLAEEFDATGSISLKRFYARRALRLLPALLICILLVGVFVSFGITSYPDVHAYWRAALATLFYLGNYIPFLGPLGHTWSLSVEEQFYLIWPIVLLGTVLKRGQTGRIWFAVAMAILFMLCRMLVHAVEFRVSGQIDLYTALCTRADSLMCGAAAAFAFRAFRPSPSTIGKLELAVIPAAGLLIYVVLKSKVYDHWIRSYGFTLIALACAIVVYVAALPPKPSKADPRIETIKLVFVLLCAGCLYTIVWLGSGDEAWSDTSQGAFLLYVCVIAVVIGQYVPFITILLTGRWLRWFGRCSYGMYLYHIPIYQALTHCELIRAPMGKPAYLMAAVQILTTVAVAALSYRFVEAPLLRLKDRKFAAPKGPMIEPHAFPLPGECA